MGNAILRDPQLCLQQFLPRLDEEGSAGLRDTDRSYIWEAAEGTDNHLHIKAERNRTPLVEEKDY